MKLFLSEVLSIGVTTKLLIMLLPLIVAFSILIGLVTKLMIFAFNIGYSIAESLISILF